LSSEVLDLLTDNGDTALVGSVELQHARAEVVRAEDTREMEAVKK
jgi:hypothetical protein